MSRALSKSSKSTSGDPTPVTGVAKTPAKLLRPMARVVDRPSCASPLDKHLLRLLTLHKDVSVKFRSVDLARMDDIAKRALLTDIQDLLNIKSTPFQTA